MSPSAATAVADHPAAIAPAPGSSDAAPRLGRIAYLGPEGTFSHLVAQKRFPADAARLLPFRSVPEIFAHLKEHPEDSAILPIENSSGGMIIPTVDGLIELAGTVFIEEELSLDVKLALMGRAGEGIHTVYSHPVPLFHCEPYLKARYPGAKAVPCASTSGSAEAAAREPGAAAIGFIQQAALYGLEVLEHPLRADVPNITLFFLISRRQRPLAAAEKTSVIVALPNHPGSLYRFLKPFAEAGVNLTRIESRPVPGQPNTHRFLVELHGTEQDPKVLAAFEGARDVSTQFTHVGSYPVLPRYQS